MANIHLGDSTGQALLEAASSASSASIALEAWEAGGDPDQVSRTAAIALRDTQAAIEAVCADEPWDRTADEPQTRRARLAGAAWLLLLAGTDEGGEIEDLISGSRLLTRAAAA